MADVEVKSSPDAVADRYKDLPPDQLEFFHTFSSEDEVWKEDKTKRFLRKVDIRLLPLLFLMYVLNSLDRSNLAQARLGSLEKDLKMRGTDFNLATSILSVVGVFSSG